MAFGRTGHESTRTIFGAASLSTRSQGEADRTLELLLRHGVNHIDAAASYGEAELRIGPWMKDHRNTFFLATKTGQRRYGPAREEIHRSLERLRVDHVDLLQLHNLVDPGEWEVAMGPGGALEAAVEARAQGLVRFIGVTGHGATVAAMHKRSLERFDFDSILLPYNHLMLRIPHYEEDFEAVVAICRERNVAVQAIKSIPRRPWPEGSQHTRTTWYEPLEDQAGIDTSVAFVFRRPELFLNTVGDIDVLPRVLDAAERYRPDWDVSDERMKQLVAEHDMHSLFV
jgi:aryl-alcohol dehydrogenase-like predicted oxidoreductase